MWPLNYFVAPHEATKFLAAAYLNNRFVNLTGARSS